MDSEMSKRPRLSGSRPSSLKLTETKDQVLLNNDDSQSQNDVFNPSKIANIISDTSPNTDLRHIFLLYYLSKEAKSFADSFDSSFYDSRYNQSASFEEVKVKSEDSLDIYSSTDSASFYGNPNSPISIAPKDLSEISYSDSPSEDESEHYDITEAIDMELTEIFIPTTDNNGPNNPNSSNSLSKHDPQNQEPESQLSNLESERLQIITHSAYDNVSNELENRDLQLDNSTQNDNHQENNPSISEFSLLNIILENKNSQNDDISQIPYDGGFSATPKYKVSNLDYSSNDSDSDSEDEITEQVDMTLSLTVDKDLSAPSNISQSSNLIESEHKETQSTSKNLNIEDIATNSPKGDNSKYLIKKIRLSNQMGELIPITSNNNLENQEIDIMNIQEIPKPKENISWSYFCESLNLTDFASTCQNLPFIDSELIYFSKNYFSDDIIISPEYYTKNISARLLKHFQDSCGFIQNKLVSTKSEFDSKINEFYMKNPTSVLNSLNDKNEFTPASIPLFHEMVNEETQAISAEFNELELNSFSNIFYDLNQCTSEIKMDSSKVSELINSTDLHITQKKSELVELKSLFNETEILVNRKKTEKLQKLKELKDNFENLKKKHKNLQHLRSQLNQKKGQLQMLSNEMREKHLYYQEVN
ncbi:hypothetical protein AYI70_g7857 [Smittium culicis]|uniref:Uncharacterized protein n=1 Tax=Smittium culicis TaxID=133412 RepID=A0A1R1XII1_9FUNG|nr:hypothetical protein AYI70_g7857 [Smittium culicis]